MPATRTIPSITRERAIYEPYPDVHFRENSRGPMVYTKLEQVPHKRYDASLHGTKYREFYSHLRVPEYLQPPPKHLLPSNPRPLPLVLKDLEVFRTLGNGVSGSVVYAKTVRNTHPLDRPGSVFAVKILEKKVLRDIDYQPDDFSPESKQMERSILTELPWNPFICGLIGTFVDPLNLYYAFEFCPKNSLRDALDSRDIFQPNVAQFYFCGVVAGLAFLHDHDIVHRDLKPENVFLGPGGYPVIGDFGTARRISDDFVRLKRPRGQAEIEATDPAGYCDWREVGTFVYSAPEIYSAPNDTQYFGPSIDWWAAGIMLYEMLTRKYPFYSKNRKKMHAMIQRGKVKWPGNIVVGKTIKALVASLLAVDPMERMGTYGVQEVLDYPWFKNVDWVKIQSREYTCPVDKDVLGPGERWHRHPLPKREIVPGLNVVEPSLELRYDERFKYKEI